MDISICIPIYQNNIHPLVNNLVEQCNAIPTLNYEICLIDDFSAPQIRQKNRPLAKLPFVNYTELTKNVGRSVIRNLLAQKAKNNYLIFIDNNVELPQQFIKKYVEYITLNPENLLCIGGCLYGSSVKEYEGSELRYCYGKAIEENLMNSDANSFTFLSGNFLVQKKVFQLIKFNETIKGYGFEDLLFLKDLQQKYQTKIDFISNPIKKTNIQTTELYLKNTISSMEILVNLYHQNIITANDVKLIKVYQNLQKNRLLKITTFLLEKFSPVIQSNLNSTNPNLTYFQLFKLFHFIKLMNQRN